MRITIELPDNKENGFVLDRVLNAVFPDKPIIRHFDDNRQVMEYHTTLDWRNKPYKRVDCHNTVIKALEQEPILDKIRAEIEEAIKVDPYRLYAAIEIIDKYNSESEDK